MWDYNCISSVKNKTEAKKKKKRLEDAALKIQFGVLYWWL